MKVSRKSFGGRKVGLAIEGSNAWICAGDLAAVVPKVTWSLLMFNVVNRYIHRQIYLPLGPVKKWVGDLENRGYKEQARDLSKLVTWAESEIRLMRKEPRHVTSSM